MTILPNPFVNSALAPAMAADDGHWPATADPADPVAVNFAESSTATGGCQEASTDSPVGSRVDVGALNFGAALSQEDALRLIDEYDLLSDHRFVLDEAAFMEAIEAPPAFLASPGLPYLAIVEVLAGHGA